MRNGEKYLDGVLVDFKAIGQLLRRRPGVRVRDIEQQPVLKDSTGARNREFAGGETFVIDLKTLESVGPEVEGFQLKPQRIFDESVLDLQMLGGEKGALRPDDRLQLGHIALTVSGERTPRKVKYGCSR